MSETCLVVKKQKITTEYRVYIRDGIEKFEDYDNLINEIQKVEVSAEFNIHLNTPGGDCSIGFSLIDQIQSLECPVNMIVDYPSCSMGAIMALCGDTLTLQPDTYIMFHDYSGGSRGKGEETILYTTNYRRMFKDRFTRLCYPFLSKAEINKMFKGEDIYIHWDDPSLENRIKRHFG